MSIWPPNLNVKGASKLVSWFFTYIFRCSGWRHRLLLMALQISASRSLNTAFSLSALPCYKSTDQKPFLIEHAITCGVSGLTSFICLWCNARIVAIGRKVCFQHTLPFMTKQRSQFGCGYLQTAQEDRLRELLTLNSNYGRTSFAA